MVIVQKEIKKVTIRPNGSEVQIRPPVPKTLLMVDEVDDDIHIDLDITDEADDEHDIWVDVHLEHE